MRAAKRRQAIARGVSPWCTSAITPRQAPEGNAVKHFENAVQAVFFEALRISLAMQAQSQATRLGGKTGKTPRKNAADLMADFLAGEPELKAGQAEPFSHPAGEALRLLGRDDQRGRLTIAIQGNRRDFIISLDYPVKHFEELLYIFEDIVASFEEIDPTETKD